MIFKNNIKILKIVFILYSSTMLPNKLDLNSETQIYKPHAKSSYNQQTIFFKLNLLFLNILL